MQKFDCLRVKPVMGVMIKAAIKEEDSKENKRPRKNHNYKMYDLLTPSGGLGKSSEEAGVLFYPCSPKADQQISPIMMVGGAPGTPVGGVVS